MDFLQTHLPVENIKLVLRHEIQASEALHLHQLLLKVSACNVRLWSDDVLLQCWNNLENIVGV